MMRKTVLGMLLLALIAGGTALAGGAECRAAKAAELAAAKAHGCTANAQECLDHMVAKLGSRGWVGIELDQDDETGILTVTGIEAGSPAVKAGFTEGDVLVALNGVKLSEENQEKVYAAKEKMTVGQKVTYTVERNGYKKDLRV